MTQAISQTDLELEADAARSRLAHSLAALSERRRRAMLVGKQISAAAGLTMALLGAKTAFSLLRSIARRDDPRVRVSRPSYVMQLAATSALSVLAVSLFKLAKPETRRALHALPSTQTTQSTIAPTREPNDITHNQEPLP